MWGTFQVRYYRVTGKSLQFPRLKILIVIISSGCLLCAFLFLLALNALLEGKYIVDFITHISKEFENSILFSARFLTMAHNCLYTYYNDD